MPEKELIDVHKERIDLGLSEERFAEECGLSRSTITRLEKGGRTKPCEITVSKVIKAIKRLKGEN